MGFKLGDVIVDRLQFGYGCRANGTPLYALTQLTEATIDITADSTDITDKDGNLVYRKYTGKKGEITATNAFFNLAIVEALSASTAEIATEDNGIIMPMIQIVDAGKPLDITGYVEGSVVVNALSLKGSMGKEYKLGSAVSDTEFAIQHTDEVKEADDSTTPASDVLTPPADANEVRYIVENKKEKIEYQEVSILSNEISDIIVFMIRNLADKVKIINVLTNDSYKFRKIEKELYEKNGIIINMNNNYKKSLIKSDIILNYDFSEEELNKYNLPRKACILNFKEHININTKSFEGINASFYEIEMPKKYLKYLLFFKRFDIATLYESFIYKNTNPVNIIKELKEDELKISFLLGKNGKIRKNEYLNLSKKIAN